MAGVAYGEHIWLTNASTASMWPNGPNVLIVCSWLNTYWSSASRPVKPLPPGTARVGLDGAIAVVEVGQDDRQVLGQLGHRLGELVEQRHGRGRRLHRLLAGDRGLPERLQRGQRRVGEPALVSGVRRGAGREVGEQRLQLTGRGVQVLEHRRVGIRGGAQLGHGGLELLEQAREALQASSSGSRPGWRCRWRPCRRSTMKFWTSLELLASAVTTASELAVSCWSVVRVVGQQVQQVVGLVERRHRAPQRGLEILGATGHRRAKLVDDQREALALGQAHDVGQQVGRDGRERVRRRQRRARRQRLAVTGRAGSRRSTRRSATGAGTGRSRPSGTPRSPCWSPAP